MSFIKAKDYLKQFNLEDKIMEFDVSSATVEEAAKAINGVEGEIVKTLSFLVNENPILIALAGDSKIDNAKYRKEFNVKAKMIPFDDVENLIGHNVGGVCPFGINENVIVYLDESLKRFEVLYPACGSSNSAVKLTIKELEKTSNYKKWIDVCKKIDQEINYEYKISEEKAILYNLLQFAIYDASQYVDIDLNESGIFDYDWFENYFIDNDRDAYFIKMGDKLIGFVMVNENLKIYSNGKSIAEFLIIPSYRRKKIGKQVAITIFDMYLGNWEVEPIENSIQAYKFWQNTIKEYTNNNYEEKNRIFTFNNKQVIL